MFMRILVLLLLLLPLSATAQSSDQGPGSMLDIKARSIGTLAFSPTLVRAVNEHNARDIDPDSIRQRHQEWTASARPTPFKVGLLRNEAGLMLEHLVRAHTDLSDAILTDRQGAAVAVHPLSEGYWQGDDPLWLAAFRTGQVQVRTADAGSSRVRIAAPVIDRGETIGILMVGVDADALATALRQE